MKKHWTISAGVLDAGLSSLATFGTGIVAIGYLEPVVIGCYALVFGTLNVAVIVPRELVYVPAEIAAVARPVSSRLSLLPRTLRLGLLPALFAAVLVCLWSLAAPPNLPPGTITGLTLTGVVCAFVSPVQDHFRRMLHIGSRGWIAAIVSLVQTIAAFGAIAYMLHLDAPHVWIPFGSLATANVVSLFVGGFLLYGRRGLPTAVESAPKFRELVNSGRWLLVSSALSPGSILLASILVTHLAGAAALGYAEAARVVARPLGVLAVGLSSALGPMSIAAGQTGQLSEARKVSSLYLKLFGSFALLYLIVAGGDTWWNPLPGILPNAYAIPGLVAAVIIGDILAVVQFPYHKELLGGGHAVALTRVEVVGAAVRCVAAASARFSYSFAIPMGQAAVMGVRAIGYGRLLRQTYSRPGAAEPSPGAIPRTVGIEISRT